MRGFPVATKALGGLFAGLVMMSMTSMGGGCVFSTASNDKKDPGYTDRGWTPVRPTSPAGWPALEWPKDNPYSSAKAVLGRRLFFEMALSMDHSMSCAACHVPDAAFTHRGRPLSHGVNGAQQTRNTPTLGNIGFGTSFQLDGASASLEAQARLPLLSPDEMGMTVEEIESRLAADTLYVRLFRQAYGNAPITIDGVTKALATYQRTLVSQQSYYDRWKAGDESAVSDAAKRGEAIFIGKKGNCAHCHVPPLFSDNGFHNNGLDSVFMDAGRGRVTGLAADSGRFKTPSLRNISVTGPYMHDARMYTLQEVVEHYNTGVVVHPRTDTILRPLGLTSAEVLDLVAFLEALTDSVFVAQRNP